MCVKEGLRIYGQINTTSRYSIGRTSPFYRPKEARAPKSDTTTEKTDQFYPLALLVGSSAAIFSSFPGYLQIWFFYKKNQICPYIRRPSLMVRRTTIGTNGVFQCMIYFHLWLCHTHVFFRLPRLLSDLYQLFLLGRSTGALASGMLQFATLRQDSQCRTFESPTEWGAENHSISRLIQIVLFRRVMWYLVLYKAVLVVGFRLVQNHFIYLSFQKVTAVQRWLRFLGGLTEVRQIGQPKIARLLNCFKLLAVGLFCGI